MRFAEALKLALQSLWANKLRSILTLVGMTISVASVIMVITLVLGADKYMSTKISGYGADVFTVARSASVIFSADDYFKYQKRKIIRIEDYEAVRDDCSKCNEVGANVSKSSKVFYSGKSSDNTDIRGYTASMFSLHNTDIAEGRALTSSDVDHATHNVVVGADIVDNILGAGDALGKELRVDGIPFTIIGVGDRQGKTLGHSQDNWVAIPLSTYQHINGTNDSLRIYARSHGDALQMDEAQNEVRVLMRTRRHDAPSDADSFELTTNDTFLDIWHQLTGLFALVIVGLAAVSLVVGGVVIMNIMLVSVSERTREIGVRKALGALQSDVRLQFLIESSVMAAVGGVLGIAFGVGAGQLIALLVGFSGAVPLWAIALGLLLSTSVGIFFGVYPASIAAKLDPIVALRSEL